MLNLNGGDPPTQPIPLGEWQSLKQVGPAVKSFSPLRAGVCVRQLNGTRTDVHHLLFLTLSCQNGTLRCILIFKFYFHCFGVIVLRVLRI